MHLKINKSKYIKLNIVFLCTFCLELFSYYYRHIFNTDWICIAAFCVFYGTLIWDNGAWFMKYFRISFWCIACLVGVFICEEAKNFYLVELAAVTRHYGSLPLCVIFFAILLITLFYADNISQSSSRKREIPFSGYIGKLNINKLISKYIKLFMFFFGAILFLIVLPNPSFKFSMDRFTYRARYLSRWSWVSNVYLILVPLLLVPHLQKRQKISIKIIIKDIIVPIIPYLFFCIWCGEKFGAYFRIFCEVIIPISVMNSYEFNNIKKTLKYLLIFGFSFLLFLYIYYSLRDSNFLIQFYNRMAQQGQLWWRIYGIYENKTIELKELLDEIKQFFLPNYTYYGTVKIMYLTTPADMVNRKLSSGSMYSAQGMELPYYYFKELGVMISAIIYPLVISFLANKYIKHLFLGYYFEAIFFSSYFFKFLGAFAAGEFKIHLMGIDDLAVVSLFILTRLLNFNYRRHSKHLEPSEKYLGKEC